MSGKEEGDIAVFLEIRGFEITTFQTHTASWLLVIIAFVVLLSLVPPFLENKQVTSDLNSDLQGAGCGEVLKGVLPVVPGNNNDTGNGGDGLFEGFEEPEKDSNP